MSFMRIAAGVMLFIAVLAGLVEWMRDGFINGAVVFIGGAVIAGVLHNHGDRNKHKSDRNY